MSLVIFHFFVHNSFQSNGNVTILYGCYFFSAKNEIREISTKTKPPCSDHQLIVTLLSWSLKGNSSHCLALTSFDAPPVALFISKKHIWSKWRNLRWRARPEFRSGPPWLTPPIADLQEPHFLRSAARPCTKFVQNDQGSLFDGFLFDWSRVGWGVNRGREAESCYRVRAQYPSWAVSTPGHPSTTKHNNPIKERRSREGTDI